MQIRTDFVTNSSSSSFIICKKFLTNDQIDAIRKHKEIANRMNLYCSDCPWNIEENEMFITGYTSIDNFSMSEFFEIIGINSSCVNWSEYRFTLPNCDKKYSSKEITETWKEILDNIRNGE